MKNKLVKAIALAMVVAMLLVGCGSSESGDSSSSSSDNGSGSSESESGTEEEASGESAGESEEASGESAEESGDASGGAAEAGSVTYPLSTDKTISWYAQDNIIPHEKFKDADESPFHTGLEKNLGVDIEWIFPTAGADANSFTMTLFADPEALPDIMGCYISDQASQYLDDELIWDLTDYLPTYAPDYWAYLQAHPDADKAAKTDDGRYYTLGFYREDGGWNDSYLGPVVRKDWMEECGLEVPTNIAEFENVIRTFHDQYGATFNAASSRFNAIGLGSGFGAYSSSDTTYYVKDGKVGLAQTQPEWRAYLSWMNKLWEEGLIDQDFFSEDDTTIKSKIHNDQCGISVTSMGQLNNWNMEREADGKEAVWIGIPYPKKEDGTIDAIFGGSGIGTHTNVVTTAADEDTMKLCLQMMNYAFTEEGNLYWNYGEEGVSWEYGDDGTPEFTSLVTDDTDVDPMTKYNGTTWGRLGIQATKLLYLKNSEAAIEANDTWYYIYPDDEDKNYAVTAGWKWPVGTTFTTEEQDELDTLGGSLGTVISEDYAAFLTGTKDVDDDAVWQKHLDDLEANDLSRILEIRQACYERYIAR